MLSSIEIKRFRGIEEGKLTDLTPLVVLVGPNGSGKSAVLEAMLIAASPATIDATTDVIRRHVAHSSDAARWLLWRAGQREQTEILVHAAPTRTRQVVLAIERSQSDADFHVTVDDVKGNRSARLKYRNGKNDGTTIPFQRLRGVDQIELIEPYLSSAAPPLYKLYTKAAEQGRRDEALEIVKAVYPRFTRMEILTENDAPVLHIYSGDYPVPATLAGDGIVSLLRLSLELAASGGGVALLEEPEAHQHPAAIRQSARVILAAVRRNIQVILTTHSLELIDGLLSESSPEDLEKFSLYRVQLDNGHLKSSRHTGADAAFLRSNIEEDLR